jgi:hypothetical protein
MVRFRVLNETPGEDMTRYMNVREPHELPGGLECWQNEVDLAFPGEDWVVRSQSGWR